MQYTNMDRQHLYLRYNQSTQFSLAKSYAFNTNKVVCQYKKILLGRKMVYYSKASITPLIDPPQPQHRQSSPLVCACANICDYCSLEGVQYKIIEASG